MNRGDSGGVPVTEPRPWPNDARIARDQAAERIAQANKRIAQALRSSPLSSEAEIGLMQAQVNILEALRWLESAGAMTRPLEL